MAGLNSGTRGGIRSSQFRKRYIAMVRHRKPLSQPWWAFFDNHVGCLVSTDFFVVPTATFAVLFVLIVLRHERRRIKHFGFTAHPTTTWVGGEEVREMIVLSSRNEMSISLLLDPNHEPTRPWGDDLDEPEELDTYDQLMWRGQQTAQTRR